MIGSGGAGHLARSLELARRMSKENVHIGIACGEGPWRSLVGAYGFSADLLYEPELSRRTCHGIGQLRADELVRAHLSDLEVIRRYRPRVLVCDWRLTGMVSAQSAGVPCVQMWNANWSELACQGRWGFVSLRKQFEMVADFWRAPYAAFCAAAGAGERTDVSEMFYGKVNLIPDHHTFRSVESLNEAPDCFWLGPLVPWPVLQTTCSSRPTYDVTVAFGGHDLRDLAEIVGCASRRAGLNVAVLSSSLAQQSDGRAWYFFPDELLSCRVVVTHGGIGTIYQALLAGRPLLVLPQHLEHLDNGQCVERLGVGLCLPIGKTDEASVTAGLKRLMASSFTSAAAQYAHILRQSAPLEKACRILLDVVANV